MKGKYTWPVEGTTTRDISSGYGERDNPVGGGREFHKGIDIAAPRGTPVKAVADGMVIHYSDRIHPVYGRYIVYLAGGLRVNNWHLERIAGEILNGELSLRRGQVIGGVGDSGNATGPHLHFQVARLDAPAGESIDPMTLFRSHARNGKRKPPGQGG